MSKFYNNLKYFSLIPLELSYEERGNYIQQKIKEAAPTYRLVIIIFGSEYCAYCPSFTMNIDETVAKPLKKYADFYYYEVDGEATPLFAPSVIPSVIIYSAGLKRFEGGGQEEFTGQVYDVVTSFILSLIPLEHVEGDEFVSNLVKEYNKKIKQKNL